MYIQLTTETVIVCVNGLSFIIRNLIEMFTELGDVYTALIVDNVRGRIRQTTLNLS